ncbi:MAG: electron transfer flavoprotein subunit beta/FixA family protein [Steroidobacteraceae bacterium]
MRIIVCVKQVNRMIHPTAVDLVTGQPDPGLMVDLLNPDDEVAVEAGLRIRQSVPGATLAVVTVGPPDSERALRFSAAMGGALVDRRIRVDAEPADAWNAAQLLAAWLRSTGFDLILCGQRAIDTGGGQLGSFVATLLDVAQVSGIVRLDLPPSGSSVVVERALGRGDREEVECRLPALLTVDRALHEPRYPTYPNRHRAEQAHIEVIRPADAAGAEPLTQIRKLAPPRPKTRKVFTIDTSLSLADRMTQMVAGGGAKKEGGTVLDVGPEEAARQIVDLLLQNRMVPGVESLGGAGKAGVEPDARG